MNYNQACAIHAHGDSMFKAGVRIRTFHAVKVYGSAYNDKQAVAVFIDAVKSEIKQEKLP